MSVFRSLYQILVFSVAGISCAVPRGLPELTPEHPAHPAAPRGQVGDLHPIAVNAPTADGDDNTHLGHTHTGHK